MTGFEHYWPAATEFPHAGVNLQNIDVSRITADYQHLCRRLSKTVLISPCFY